MSSLLAFRNVTIKPIKALIATRKSAHPTEKAAFLDLSHFYGYPQEGDCVEKVHQNSYAFASPEFMWRRCALSFHAATALLIYGELMAEWTGSHAG